MRRTRMKGGERRTAIVACAIRLFAQKGFRGTTTRELATVLGVTEPVLYQHFQTKGDIYRAILETKANETLARSVELRKYADAEDDSRFLAALADLILSRYEQDESFIRLLLYSALERHELSRVFFEQQLLQFHEMVASYIRKRIRKGAFRRTDAATSALAFIGMVSYHGLMLVLYPEPVIKRSRRKVIREMVKAFLNGVCPPGDRRDSGRAATRRRKRVY